MMYAILSALFEGAVALGPFLIGAMFDHFRDLRKEQR